MTGYEHGQQDFDFNRGYTEDEPGEQDDEILEYLLDYSRGWTEAVHKWAEPHSTHLDR